MLMMNTQDLYQYSILHFLIQCKKSNHYFVDYKTEIRHTRRFFASVNYDIFKRENDVSKMKLSYITISISQCSFWWLISFMTDSISISNLHSLLMDNSSQSLENYSCRWLRSRLHITMLNKFYKFDLKKWLYSISK